MKSEQVRPLHRLTPLRDDPVTGWLDRGELFRVRLTGWGGWAAFGISVLALRVVLGIVLVRLYIVDPRVSGVAAAVIGVALIEPVRRAILRMQSAKAAAIARQKVASSARAVDEWSALDYHPDGALVSLVGWARGQLHLGQRVAGQPCIGLAVPCQQKYPGILETLHDFDLLDEGGQPVPVRVAGGRMLGEANTSLGGGTEQILLVASLGLPAGALLSSWNAFAIREGDPLLVFGFKRTSIDPGMFGIRQAPSRSEIVSEPNRPMLIFAIGAERRVGPPST
jgi:hypothetical protein